MQLKYWRRALLILLGTVVLCAGQTTAPPTSAPPQPPPKKKKHKINVSETAAPRGQDGDAVAGVVVGADGKQVEGATVTLSSADDPTQRWSAKTDSKGHFSFDATLPPGSYMATAAANGLISDATKISIPEKNAASLHLKLKTHSSADKK
jgi:hypothetical protein